MNPNYNANVTIYHKNGKSWEKVFVNGVSWSSQDAASGSGTGEKKESSFTVRIPDSLRFNHFSIGDIVVLGHCTKEITNRTPNTASELLAHVSDAFRISKIKDNTRFIADKHWKLEGGIRNEY